MGRYDPQWVREHYNTYGEKEWDRWEATPADGVKLHIHRTVLESHVHRGDRVLEIGPGPGRFTQVLANLGARIHIVDISDTQLELNRRRGERLGFGTAVEERIRGDLCDMHRFEADHFDVVLCYGGPLSYVFEKRDLALQEIVRVLKPGGKALLSVMGLWGAVHEYLLEVLTEVPDEENAEIIRTGDLHPETYSASQHHCHMFRASELRSALEGSGLSVVSMFASNVVSGAFGDRLADIQKNPERWEELLRIEREACAEEGCVEAKKTA
ncbi:MAG: class I SAM-dependent methyltransferase [Planctomycetota bacterium]|jgi:SAM-dependent methyltransferase